VIHLGEGERHRKIVARVSAHAVVEKDVVAVERPNQGAVEENGIRRRGPSGSFFLRERGMAHGPSSPLFLYQRVRARRKVGADKRAVSWATECPDYGTHRLHGGVIERPEGAGDSV